MPSQAYLFHQTRPGVFDLTRARTGSIRDQLLRATMLSRDLLDTGEVSKGNQQVLIFGGGPAGMTAALEMARAGVSSVVIEMEREPFHALIYSAARRISPFEYDWPHPHFAEPVFPMAETGVQLTQREATSTRLAMVWGSLWTHWKRNLDGRDGRGHIEFLRAQADHFKVPERRTSAGLFEVSGPWASSASSQRDFRAVLYCLGPKDERTFQDPERDPRADLRDPDTVDWNGYIGPKFWRDGFVTDADSDFPYRRIVISGGGDGAMQDLQQVATGMFGKVLLSRLQEEMTRLKLGSLAPPAALREILAAEDFARRAHAWRNSGVTFDFHRHWANRFEQLIKKRISRFKPTELASLARAIFRKPFQGAGARISWNYSDDTPGHCYALNRFLSLVLTELSRHLGGAPAITVWPSTVVKRIRPLDAHECGSWATCRGKPHLVTYQSGEEVEDADLIIIRHGLQFQDKALCAGAPIGEQLLPYDIPT